MTRPEALNIAVDARPLLHPNSGIGRCTNSLLEQMMDTGHRWHFYSSRPLKLSTPLAEASPVVRVPKGPIPSLVVSQLHYSYWARRDNIDVFWSPRHHLPLMLSNRMAKVVSVYDLVWKRYPQTMRTMGRWQERILMPISIKQADRIAAVSEFTCSELSTFFQNSVSKLDLIPGAAFTTSVSALEDNNQDVERYMLVVGSLEPRKNLSRLLKAYRHYLDRSSTSFGLVIVGADSWGGEDIDQLIASNNLGTRVRVVRSASDHQLASLYRNAYCLLMPSLYEGFGLPAVEAMAFGKPVVVSKDSSISEVAGKAGLLVNPTEISSIANGICQIAEDEDLYRRLSSQANRESARYSWKSSADKLLAIFDDLHRLKQQQ